MNTNPKFNTDIPWTTYTKEPRTMRTPTPASVSNDIARIADHDTHEAIRAITLALVDLITSGTMNDFPFKQDVAEATAQLAEVAGITYTEPR